MGELGVLLARRPHNVVDFFLILLAREMQDLSMH